ncbi:MAG: 3-keto-disaccharide hydrolase, partial [Planctomycetota bacterium]
VMIAVVAVWQLEFAEIAWAGGKPKLVYAKDGSGIYGFKDTPILPWCGYHQHDPDRPAPEKVTPGNSSTQEKVGTAPSGAIVLFDGRDLSAWQPSQWKVENGCLEATEGLLTTKEAFGDFQLHLEWQAPDPPRGERFNRGNNGVMIMGRYEIQIFDSYTEKIYPDGQAAAIYGQTPPLVNACRKPGQWQSYDIVFFAPVFKSGKLEKPARVTMFHNGLLVHHNQQIMGRTGHGTLPSYDKPIPSKMPFALAAHRNPVRFRNIWIRPL